MATNENLIPIPGRLHSVATEGHVAGADEIFDDSLNKLQSTINSEVDEIIDDVALIDTTESSPAVVPGFDPQTDTVHVTAQTLSETQKAQVRNNIGLGDVDAKINQAVASEASQRAAADSSLQSSISAEATARANAVSAEASRARAAESALQNNIEALTQSNIVVVADHTSVSSPDPLTIYREQGTNTYSDWMYQNGSWNKMAEYDNAIDDVPTAGSANLVKSGGVYPTKLAVDSITVKNNNILDLNNAVIGEYVNPVYHNIVSEPTFFSTGRIPVTAGQTLYFYNLGKLVVLKNGSYDASLDNTADNITEPWTVPAGVTEIIMRGWVDDIESPAYPYISVGVDVREPYGYSLNTSNGVEQNSELPVKSKDVYEFVNDNIDDIEQKTENPESLYSEIDNAEKGLRNITKDAEEHHMPQVFNNNIELNQKAYESLIGSMGHFGIHQISDIEFGQKQVVFSSEDPDVTTMEDIRSQNHSIFKYKGMYYMYYLACGTEGFQFWDIPNTSQYAPYCVLFAYSEDGVTWHRGFPSGVTPPWGNEYPNSIKALDNNGNPVNEPWGTFFVVDDDEYPFRCIAANGYLTMRFSRDGFTWDKEVVIDSTQYRDTESGVVVRNGVIKIYTRGWTGGYPPETIHGYGSRIIVVIYCNMEGEKICPAVPFAVLDSNYNAPLAILDDRREIIFPTLYRGESTPAIVNPYIIDGVKIKNLHVDNEYLMDNGYWKSVWFVPCGRLFCENSKFYTYFNACDAVHNGMASATAKCKLYRVEVILKSDMVLNNENIV